MFRGVNVLNLDGKGRMTMPTRYRARLEACCRGQMVFTLDPDQCLLLYPLPEWEEIERKLVRLPSLNKQARRLQRLYLGHATEVELDGQGRVLVPPPLRSVVGLDKQAVLIGQGNKFELWSESHWNDEREQCMADAAGDWSLPAELGSLSL